MQLLTHTQPGTHRLIRQTMGLYSLFEDTWELKRQRQRYSFCVDFRIPPVQCLNCHFCYTQIIIQADKTNNAHRLPFLSID